MPTNTVKDISGPSTTQNTGFEWRASSPRSQQILAQGNCSFKVRTVFYAACVVLCLAGWSSIKGQNTSVRIAVPSVVPPRIEIEASLPNPTSTLRFRNAYAGILGLGERIEKVEGIRDNGERVEVQRLAPGEFQAEEKFSRFIYEVSLIQVTQPAQMSHVSSLNQDRGLLMMADLLPQLPATTANAPSLIFDVATPPGWTVTSNVGSDGRQFLTDKPEDAVFLIGPSVREKRQRLGTTNVSIISSGKWPFADDDAFKITARILAEYSRITQFGLKSSAVLMLVPYSGETGPESWSAETRGNAVVLLLGRKASGKRVLARLGVVLSHELFHLWVPNSLSLEGDYDWFFEGFTLYQALRTDLRLGLISFDDFLDTIARVYDSYRSSREADTLSLIEASERRWTTSSSLVYEKGMLVAFLYDLMLRAQTNCGASLEGVYVDLFRRFGTGQGSANETIIRILSERDGLKSFAHDQIQTPGKISLEGVLSSYGIELQSEAPGSTKLVVWRNLSKTQQRFLSCIGYKE